MATHVSAMGKPVDMAGLRQKNRNVRAVGNMNVDAEGNTLDSHNNVIDDSTSRVNRVYNRTTQNPSAVNRPAPQVRSRVTPAPDANKVVPAPSVVSVNEAPELSQRELNDLSEFDSEEPVGKEQPKKK